MEIRLKECDTVFLLDVPLEVCLSGAKSRIGKKREDLPWIEKEFDKEFMQWIMDFPKKELPPIYRLLDQYRGKKDIVIFKSRRKRKSIWKKCMGTVPFNVFMFSSMQRKYAAMRRMRRAENRGR